MVLPRSLWTIIIVSVVTVLIWVWAAGETREQQIITGTVAVAVVDTSGQGHWHLTPDHVSVRMAIEGTRLTNTRFENAIENGLVIEITPRRGSHTIDLLTELSDHPVVEDSLAAIRDVEPRTVSVNADPVVEITARVQPELPAGVRTAATPTAQPEQVTIQLPQTLRDRLPAEPVVMASLSRTDVDRLEPGIPQTIEMVPLMIPGLAGSPAAQSAVSISPAHVQLLFTIRSRSQSTTVDRVQLRVAADDKDLAQHSVRLAEVALRNVTITADADVIRHIQSEDPAQRATVLAIIDLNPLEMERRITEKRVSYFIAMIPDDNGGRRGVIVSASIDGDPTPPLVNMTIAPHDDGE